MGLSFVTGMSTEADHLPTGHPELNCHHARSVAEEESHQKCVFEAHRNFLCRIPLLPICEFERIALSEQAVFNYFSDHPTAKLALYIRG